MHESIINFINNQTTRIDNSNASIAHKKTRISKFRNAREMFDHARKITKANDLSLIGTPKFKKTATSHIFSGMSAAGEAAATGSTYGALGHLSRAAYGYGMRGKEIYDMYKHLKHKTGVGANFMSEETINEGKHWNRLKKSMPKAFDGDKDSEEATDRDLIRPMKYAALGGFVGGTVGGPAGIMAGAATGANIGAVVSTAKFGKRVYDHYKKLKALGEDTSEFLQAVISENELDCNVEELESFLNETSYHKDMNDSKPVTVHGVKGVKSKPFKKTFKHMAHFDKWMESNGENVDIQYVTQDERYGLKKEENDMTTQIIESCIENKPADLTDIFDQLIKEKIADYIDGYKTYIAENYFVETTDDVDHNSYVKQLKQHIHNKDHFDKVYNAIDKMLPKDSIEIAKRFTSENPKNHKEAIMRIGQERLRVARAKHMQDSASKAKLWQNLF